MNEGKFNNPAKPGPGPAARRRPLEIAPHSKPYPRIVRFKNNRANLLKTFIGMAKGQDLLVRMTVKADRTRIQGAANNARVRIKIEDHPSLNTVRVTSLGPQRERVMSKSAPGRVRYFRTRPSPPDPNAKPGKKHDGATGPGSAARTRRNVPDIFS